ncbi:MAG: HAMP domain-containing histidine kinase [Polaromonas sp.]|uniref:sensor histidine kinase n=1 Tax=Polaromonas sp. TaxID=1869339 RepID=UPI0025CEAD02|nr:HAMP domain-containing sensor histidine kinase [Polaromonas sp.]MBI2726036.1 HAMP domain-containing histidine kinase [Polaromonas sp.]
MAFLLIAALLGASSLRALYTLESLTTQSRQSAAKALELSAAAQSLTERSVSMERASRQAIVLEDRVLRDRFITAARDAAAVLERLARQGVPDELITQWKTRVEAITTLLTGPIASAVEREQQVAREFREMDVVSTAIAQQVQQTIEAQNRGLLDTLESSRASLARQVISAVVLAIALALAFGIWLTRPLRQLEKAIIGLGENRLDESIAIQGPADLQLVGQRLDWLRLRLVELDADKARFLRHISHELKTPLASLREGVSLLEDGVAGELSDNQREVARILRHNTGVLQGQIEDLLQFNAAAFEARQLHREKTDLVQLVEAQVEAQRLQWRARELRVSVEGEAVQMEVDAEKIGTAIANLISNAIRFSPVGGLLRIRLRKLPESVCIDIQDEGPGIAEADRKRVFEPFFRGERQPLDAIRGSGIGLSIVHEYISAHGGRVNLIPDSPGAHFRIELPHAFRH